MPQTQGLVKLQGLVRIHRQALPAGSLLPHAGCHSSHFTDLHGINMKIGQNKLWCLFEVYEVMHQLLCKDWV